MWLSRSLSLLLLLVLSSPLSVLALEANILSFHGILKRQTGGSGSILNQVPEGCRTTCEPFDIILTGCTTPKCVCDVPNYVALKICMDCVVDYGTGTPTYPGLREGGQAVLNTFGSDCQHQGIILSPISLNFSPAPGPPGVATVTTIPSIATRSQITSTSSTTGRSGSGSGGHGTSGSGSLVLSVSLASLAAVIAGVVVTLLQSS